MITYADISEAVTKKLSTTGIEVNSRDVKEGYNRPSFFVQLNNNQRSGDENQIHKSSIVQIYYFPTDRYECTIEVLNMQETLGELFDLKLPINDRLINVDNFDTFVSDGILNCTFDIEFYSARERSKYEQHPNELMGELELNKE